MAQFKRYLGDGVELDFDGHRVILTNPQGRVYLKPQIVETFKSALTDLKAELRQAKRLSRITPEEYFVRSQK